MSVKIIANPVAGRGKVLQNLPIIDKIMSRSQLEYEIIKTKYPGHGTEIARKYAEREGCSAVVAVGGDGTASEVFNGVANTSTPMGIIPSGMGNDMARSLNIPVDIKKATEIILDPTEKKIDIGQAKERKFCVCGIGFPTEVMKKTNAARDGILNGPGAILTSIFQVITKLKSTPLQIEIDDKVIDIEGTAVLIMNTRYTGGGLKFITDGHPDDGLLDVFMVGDVGKIDLTLNLPKAYLGRPITHPNVHFYKGKRVRVSSKFPLDKMFDGDILGQTPLEVTLLPQALTILVPE